MDGPAAASGVLCESGAGGSCRNADLETILATDLNQLGQVPKLQTLAMSVLRARLLAELEALLAALSKGGAGAAGRGKSKGDGDASKGDGDASPRSFILDGSPKSTRPAELGGDAELRMACLGGAAPRGGRDATAITGDSMVRIRRGLARACAGWSKHWSPRVERATWACLRQRGGG